MIVGCVIADLPSAVPVAKDIENRASLLRALSFAEPELVDALRETQ